MSERTATVVIPTYGRPRALARCLRSLAAGYRLPDAIWVADQSADDATRALVAEWPAVTYHHLDRPNASAARNLGLQAPTDLVAYLDDDCLADPAWLAALVGEMAGAPADGPVSVTGRVLPLLGRRSSVPVAARAGAARRVFCAAAGELDGGAWAPWDVGSGANLLVARASLAAVGGFDPDLGPGTPARAAEDIDLLYRLARTGTIVYQPAAVVYHAATTRRARLARRYPYGLGMGAMLAKHLAAREPAARRLMGLYLRHQVAQALRGGRWGLPETLLVLAGAGRGLLPALIHSSHRSLP